jgi:hypothetical protein
LGIDARGIFCDPFRVMKNKLSEHEKIQREWDARDNRRVKAEDRAWDKMGEQLDAADAMIGELYRDGKTVYYVWPQGGKYREGSWGELTSFLIRNRYV